VGLEAITRVEFSTRYLFTLSSAASLAPEDEEKVVHCLHDRMTQCRYASPLTTFQQKVETDEVYEVDVVGRGKKALQEANRKLGECVIAILNAPTALRKKTNNTKVLHSTHTLNTKQYNLHSLRTRGSTLHNGKTVKQRYTHIDSRL
jgi:hypothetical protein